MRGGSQGMNEPWLSGNSYLRLLSSLYQDSNKVMTFCMQSEAELQLALEAIQKFVRSTNTIKGRRKECRIKISLHDVDSRETCT